MSMRPYEILIAEDSAPDLRLILYCFGLGPSPKNLHTVTNGDEALEFLARRNRYKDAPRPDLVLLDLNLPRQSGLEVLERIKNDPDLQSITVVVLTTSNAPRDIRAAYEGRANCYVVKPMDLDAFTQAILGIEEFWLRVSSLPTYTEIQGKQRDSEEERSAGGPGPVLRSRKAPRRRSSREWLLPRLVRRPARTRP